MPVWVWGRLEAFRFFRWCPDWMLPILNNDLVWAWKLVMRIPDLKRAVSGPSAPLRPEMVKFDPNFCYCGCRPRKTVFKRKRAVSGPSPLLGPEMVKFTPNFCYCAADQEKVVFKRKRPFLAHPLGPKMLKFGLQGFRVFQKSPAPQQRFQSSPRPWRPPQSSTRLQGPPGFQGERPARPPKPGPPRGPTGTFRISKNSPLSSCQVSCPKICQQRGFREASEGGLRGPLKRTIWRTREGLGYLILRAT